MSVTYVANKIVRCVLAKQEVRLEKQMETKNEKQASELLSQCSNSANSFCACNFCLTRDCLLKRKLPVSSAESNKIMIRCFFSLERRLNAQIQWSHNDANYMQMVFFLKKKEYLHRKCR